MRDIRVQCHVCHRLVTMAHDAQTPYECNGCRQMRIEREYDNEMAGFAQGHDRYGSLSGCDEEL